MLNKVIAVPQIWYEKIMSIATSVFLHNAYKEDTPTVKAVRVDVLDVMQTYIETCNGSSAIYMSGDQSDANLEACIRMLNVYNNPVKGMLYYVQEGSTKAIHLLIRPREEVGGVSLTMFTAVDGEDRNFYFGKIEGSVVPETVDALSTYAIMNDKDIVNVVNELLKSSAFNNYPVEYVYTLSDYKTLTKIKIKDWGESKDV